MNQNKFPASDDARVVIAVTRRMPPVEQELGQTTIYKTYT
jgi:hypothetical protein